MNSSETVIPDTSTWQPGTINTGPMQLEVTMELETLAEQLEPVIEEAYAWQFGFHSQLGRPGEVKRPSGGEKGSVDAGVKFLADSIHVVSRSDNSEDKKHEIINTLLDIVVNGTYSGQVIDMTYSEYLNKTRIVSTHETDDINQATMFGKKRGSAYEKVRRRIGLSRLYLESPEAADYLIQSQTIGLHGTRSGALTSILDEGLLSTAELRIRGNQPVSGEHVNNGLDGQPTISLIDWQSSRWLHNYSGDEEAITLETINKQIADTQKHIDKNQVMSEDKSDSDTGTGQSNSFYTQGLESLVAQLRHARDLLQSKSVSAEQKSLLEDNYPVIVGVDRSALARDEMPIIPDGNVEGEFMINKEINNSSLSMIFVPVQRIIDVEKMCKDRGLNIRVFDIDLYRRAFPFRFSISEPRNS